MIEVNSLGKSFNDKKVLSNLSFSVKAGECLGVIGSNGAGKTTLLKILSGQITSDCGTIFYFSQLFKGSESVTLRKIGVGISTDQLIEELSAFEYLMFIGQLYNVPKSDLCQRVNDILSFLFETEDVMHQAISTFSFGMKKKLLICSAIIHKPEVILLDEPLAGLDLLSVEKIVTVLEAIKKRSALIISSHDLNFVERICDLIAVFERGNVLYQGATETFINSHSSLKNSFFELLIPNQENLSDRILWLHE